MSKGLSWVQGSSGNVIFLFKLRDFRGYNHKLFSQPAFICLIASSVKWRRIKSGLSGGKWCIESYIRICTVRIKVYNDSVAVHGILQCASFNPIKCKCCQCKLWLHYSCISLATLFHSHIEKGQRFCECVLWWTCTGRDLLPSAVS